MADEKALVPTVSIEVLGECLRLEVAKAFGRPVERFTNSAHKEAYRDIAQELLKRARLVQPIRIVRGTVRWHESYTSVQWIEPSDGSPDVLLTSLGLEGELVELIQVEPVE